MIVQFQWENEEAVYQIQDAKVINTEIMKQVLNESLPYFAGQETTEDVVSQLEKQYELYLKE